MALTASLWQDTESTYLDLGKASEALGAESVGGSHLCKEDDGAVLTLHQKRSSKGGGLGQRSGCLLWCLRDDEDQFRLPASGDPKLRLYEEGCSQSPAQQMEFGCQSIESNVGLSACLLEGYGLPRSEIRAAKVNLSNFLM